MIHNIFVKAIYGENNYLYISSKTKHCSSHQLVNWKQNRDPTNEYLKIMYSTFISLSFEGLKILTWKESNESKLLINLKLHLFDVNDPFV